VRRWLVAAVLALLPAAAGAESWPRWTCSLDAVDANLTRCARSQDFSPASFVITDIVAQSTTATAGQFLVRYGTGTNCGTGTASIFPAAASAVRIAAPANTSAPAIIRFETGLLVPSGQDLCVLGVGTNTVTITITGYLVP